MTERVLLVDDDPDLLQGLKRRLQKRYDISTAEGGEAALALIDESNPFAVVVSDMRMPGMTGLEVLKKLQKLSPNTQRIMLTGNLDQETAVNAVNQGKIFQFYTKPCTAEKLSEGIDQAIRQYQIITVERDLLEQTLAGSVKVLNDILGLAAPEAFPQHSRFRDWAKLVGAELELSQPWQLEIAAMLTPIGYAALPPEITTKWRAGEPLSAEEQKIVNAHPAAAKRLITNIPRMTEVAEIVYYQDKWYNGTGYPEDDVKEEAIPQGARIIKIFKALNELCGIESPDVHAFAKLAGQLGKFDLELLYRMQTCLIEGESSKLEA